MTEFSPPDSGTRDSSKSMLVESLMPQLKTELARLVAIESVSSAGYPEPRRPLVDTSELILGLLRDAGVEKPRRAGAARLILGVVGVFSVETGFATAKWAGVSVIGLYSLLATRSAGLSLRLSMVTATFFSLIGLGLVLLKQYFH